MLINWKKENSSTSICHDKVTIYFGHPPSTGNVNRPSSNWQSFIVYIYLDWTGRAARIAWLFMCSCREERNSKKPNTFPFEISELNVLVTATNPHLYRPFEYNLTYILLMNINEFIGWIKHLSNLIISQTKRFNFIYHPIRYKFSKYFWFDRLPIRLDEIFCSVCTFCCDIWISLDSICNCTNILRNARPNVPANVNAIRLQIA